MQLVNEILLFLLLALFVSLSHVPLPQNPVSLASSSLSLKIEHIGGIQGDNTSTAADLGEPPNDQRVFNQKVEAAVAQRLNKK